MSFASRLSALCGSMIGSAIGLALAFAAMQPAGANEGVSVFADPSKIAAIGGSITEIVYALGEEKHLVARDSTSNFPKAALDLPDVGYMRQLSPEGVLSVNPTGILALYGSGPKEAVDVLKKTSIPFIEVPELYSREGILQKVRIVGKALGVEAKAEVLAKALDAKLTAAEKQTASIKERKRVLFVLSIQGGKIRAAGSETAADGMVKLAGGVNAVEGFSGYKQMSDEAIITARPDVILMMTNAGPPVSDDELFDNPSIASTPAGTARKLIRIDGAYLLGFGPRTADAIHDLAVSLYGAQVTD
ncbi:MULTISPECIES: hemin ABC transporter substrate-binding protein [unclassified Mesorhizobium]|uniref:heme/hemin ABC transporter substrate-binding protein n=1 Tax=unclassified Mesorhizobium TaxID=325217 RepID=UPI000FD9FBD6|nr:MULTISPECIES: hemin ABC transporter substrate-binding protein [unclassified Mesorhizobium]TGR38829.1 hemin ABC transporter substrate-binding protein [bacterium M00.F.Ca.ET.199.01.1.1]TGU27440.1 hemin ABC transporter substrate-binding protein [bacterium M00.F.Ca.ET.156.01.1.1]TGV83865.1 hemin ABC transporter substrate-binding protein [Mesorhizobium sp. M00.F.Ca.ET.149.01.1.1]TGR20554.1 hemin ABC transporter substrate-binding protein [Mesorhizobium sp. M8A.F.Ca.ET.202.01.1.1]TGR22593.1 hemin 